MKETKNDTNLCKSVFKSGKETTSQKEFTDKWIELINILEKNKSTLSVGRLRN